MENSFRQRTPFPTFSLVYTLSAARNLALRDRGLSVNFLFVGANGSARQRFQPLVPAKGLLHPPILQRVKTDHRHPRPRPQAIGYPPQGDLQRFQFVVHRDSQGLERPRGRIDPLSARRARHATADQLGQLRGRLDRLCRRRSTIARAIRRLYRSSP